MLTLVRRFIVLSIVAATLATVGCQSGDGLARESISGTVSLDGKPLESGNINFTPTGATEASSAAQALLKNGNFDIATAQGLVTGEYLVTVSSPQPGKSAARTKARRAAPGVADSVSGTGAEDAESEPELHETVPAKYNTSSTLKAEVKRGGPNKFEFALTTK